MTPGVYLRRCRLAAGMSLDDLALCLDTAPYRVSAVVRVEWLGLIEEGVTRLTISTALALAAVQGLGFDLDELGMIDTDPMSFRFVVAPTLAEHR